MGLASAILLSIAVGITAALRSRLGLRQALAVGVSAAVLSASAVGLVLMDAQLLHRGPLRLGLAGAALGWAALVWWLRRRWPVDGRTGPADETGARWVGVGLLVVLVIGTGLRLQPSPYLHGGQDQGIYVNVGHHIARTGRLRPVDRVMAGRVRGIAGELITQAHRIRPVPPDSPLAGVREGRWIAGLHVEDAAAGRLMPGFFHLLPVWFAMAELDFGFARSTWPLVLLAWLSLLAAFCVGSRLGAGADPNRDARRRGWAVGLLAATGLALHPLDLWISTFTVTENLARASLLGAAALALEASAAEQRGRPGATLLASLAGLTFAAGVFARGSMLALAVVLVAGLILARPVAPRSRRALLLTTVVGTTLGAVQAILHSWPYFFSAASNHFHVPRIKPFQSEAVASAVVVGALVLLASLGVTRARRRWPRIDRTDGLLRIGAGLALLAGVAAVVYRAVDTTDAYGPHQQVLDVLRRHGGEGALLLAFAGLLAWVRRADAAQLPWLLVATVIVLLTTLKEGIRYEQYYARYLVGDAIPVLMVASGWAVVHVGQRVAARFGPRPAAAVVAAAMLGWWLPPMRVLDRPIYWTRDLTHAAEDLSALFEQVPDDAVLFFDARAPGRWRGILATPALLSFDRNVIVYPNNRLVERAVTAGVPVFMLSGGWEAADRQRWPDAGPWRTRVMARGVYRARRAEVVEGAMPQRMVDWGGRWELHRIDRSLWRGHGAFSLYPGSEFISSPRPDTLATEVLPLTWEAGARVELHGTAQARADCTMTAELRGRERVTLTALPSRPTGPRLFEMPAASPDTTDAAIVLTEACPDGRPLTWTRLSMRWERPRATATVP